MTLGHQIESSASLEIPPVAPRSAMFGYHMLGMAVLLLAQHPSLYEDWKAFLEQWVGTFCFAIIGAGIAVGVGRLFFSPNLKERTWRVFLMVAWGGTLLQLFAQWVLPDPGQKHAFKEEVLIVQPAPVIVVPTGRALPPPKALARAVDKPPPQSKIVAKGDDKPQARKQAAAQDTVKLPIQPPTAASSSDVEAPSARGRGAGKQMIPVSASSEVGVEFDFASARKSGFTATQMLDYFVSRRYGNDRVSAAIAHARKEGRDDDEILYYLEAGKPLR